MDEKREETYERIPWETMEKPGKDRQWLILGVAAALVAGALGYSFMSNRGVASIGPNPPPVVDQGLVDSASPALVSPGVAPPVAVTPPTAPPVSAPTALAEADLYALSPERLMLVASAHAEWFVAEYLAVSGSEDDQAVLRNLLPADIPLPVPAEGTLVFVEWVEAIGIEEVGPARFSVEVLSRYLVASDGENYQRMPPESLVIEIDMGSGEPRVTGAPRISPFTAMASVPVGLVEVPPDLIPLVEQTHPLSEIVGGIPNDDGSWDVTVINQTNGVNRPETIRVAP